MSFKEFKRVFMEYFILTFVFTTSGAFHFFLWIDVTVWYNFLSTCKNCFSIFLVRYVCEQWVLSLLSRNVFISPLFLEDSFAGYGIFGSRLFSFGPSSMSFHCLLSSPPPRPTMKSQLLIILFLSARGVSFLFFRDFLFIFQQVDYDMSRCISLCI